MKKSMLHENRRVEILDQKSIEKILGSENRKKTILVFSLHKRKACD
jgi:hypothetical protein